MRRQLKSRKGFEEIIVKSPVMQKIFDLVEKVTESDTPVVIAGETGTDGPPRAPPRVTTKRGTQCTNQEHPGEAKNRLPLLSHPPFLPVFPFQQKQDSTNDDERHNDDTECYDHRLSSSIIAYPFRINR